MSPFSQELIELLTQSLPDISFQTINKETELIKSDTSRFCIITSTLFTTPITDTILEERKQLVSEYRANGFETLVFWEDQWRVSKEIILARIKSKLQENKKIYGRQSKVITIDKTIAKTFLDKNHLLGFINSKYYLGIAHHDSIIAVASFGPIRKMNDPQRSTSSDLIRFATLPNLSIIGGLSKLIQHFQKMSQIGDLMTYIPLEWSTGSSFQKIGFIETQITNPLLFETIKGLRNKKTQSPNAFDLGNIKMILDFNK